MVDSFHAGGNEYVNNHHYEKGAKNIFLSYSFFLARCKQEWKGYMRNQYSQWNVSAIYYRIKERLLLNMDSLMSRSLIHERIIGNYKF